jgi:hypothetical protein
VTDPGEGWRGRERVTDGMSAARGGANTCQGPRTSVRALGFAGEGPRWLSRVRQGGGGVGMAAEDCYLATHTRSPMTIRHGLVARAAQRCRT